MDVPDELWSLAEMQDGLLTRQQALAHGLTSAQIEHALGRGHDWRPVARGVYATFTGPLGRRHVIRAALLRAGGDAMVTAGHACQAYGMRYVPEDSDVRLLVPASNKRVVSGVRFIRVASPPRARWVGGLPLAPPDRAVLDACRDLTSLRVVRAALCECVQRGLTVPERIAARLGNACWNGAGLVRRALADVAAGCRSAPECELRDLVRSSLVITEPAWNHRVPGAPGRPLIPDACWEDARVVVEIDSAEWHRYGNTVEETERRRARYASLGWTVVPVSPRRLRTDAERVLAEIESAVLHGRRLRA